MAMELSCDFAYLEIGEKSIAFDIDTTRDEEFFAESLQNAFLTYQKKRIHQLKERDKKETAVPHPISCEQKEELRNLFISRLFYYIGTPYAKRFHKPSCPYYRRKLFLDCCGLVRRVLRDLSADFGFEVGPWNQAYLYDTLPIKLSSSTDMKHGDLVFISATYFDKKRKRQIHDMVHVEVWLGNGESTVGSRWFKGTVQVFDSYKFISTSYYNMKYHFCSIDTWLDGFCESFCPKHKWQQGSYHTRKHSIFNWRQSDIAITTLS